MWLVKMPKPKIALCLTKHGVGKMPKSHYGFVYEKAWSGRKYQSKKYLCLKKHKMDTT
jgi:hypothetical protein